MCTLERAIEIALEAHTGQTDKADEPYILHPLELMLEMDSREEMMAAVLHDAVEDSDLSIEDLRQKEDFSKEVIEAVDKLTRRESDTYEEFIEKVKQDEIAREVKRADIEHNMDITRLEDVSKKDKERLSKYHSSWKELTGQ
jgi:(p)ppGpp synthase/HD superfamily hydrolase